MEKHKLCVTLCWKCREFYEKKFGLSYWVSPSNHCHHPVPEEKPKEKCWCELEGEKRLQLHDYIVDQWNLGHYQKRATEVAKFCPNCGRKL